MSMSGYAKGGYTHESLDAWLTASETINKEKEKIGRLLSMATSIVRNSIRNTPRRSHLIIGDVPLDIAGKSKHLLRVSKNPQAGMFDLAVGHFGNVPDRFDTIYELKYVDRKYRVEDIPVRLVKPIRLALPLAFEKIADHFDYLDESFHELVEIAKDMNAKLLGDSRPPTIEPGDQIIMTSLDRTGVGLDLIQLRTPHGTGYTVKAEQRWMGRMDSIQNLAELLGKISGLRVELASDTGTAISAFFR